MVNVTGCCLCEQESILMTETSMDDTLMLSSFSVTVWVPGFVELVCCTFLPSSQEHSISSVKIYGFPSAERASLDLVLHRNLTPHRKTVII